MNATWDVVAHRGLLATSALVWCVWVARRAARRGPTPAASDDVAAPGLEPPPVPWTLLDLGIAAFVWMTVLAGGQGLATGWLDVRPGTPLAEMPPETLDLWLLVSGLLLLVATLAAAAAVSARSGARWPDWRGPSRAAGEEASSRWRDIRCDVQAGLGRFVLLAGPVLGLQEWLASYFPSRHPLLEALRRHPDGDLLLAVAFSAVLVAPWAEEVQFRVLLQGWLSRVAQGWRARAGAATAFARLTSTHGPTCVSATLFALAHYSHGPDPIPLWLFGLGLGDLYRRDRRLLPVVVCHAALNAWSMLLVAAELSRATTS